MEFPAGKRQKHCDIGDGDRISHLPDSLLCHILSFLPTKSSAQTCLLSRRWRSVWTSVPALDLCDESFEYLNKRRRAVSAWASSFRKFVIKVLSLRSHLCVQILRLNFLNLCDVSPVVSLILNAILPTVEEIDLSAVNGTLHLPQIPFNFGHLSVLKLEGKVIELNFPESVSMPNLKVFHVRYESTSDSCAVNVARLLRGSPILEELVIHSESDVTENQNFSIVSSSLKALEFWFPALNYGYNDNLVVIDAPKLEFLDVNAKGFKIDLKNTPSILNASIATRECYYDEYEFQEPPSNLWTMVNTKVMCLPFYIVKDPSVYELMHFTNLKKLVLRYCGKDGLSMLTQILKKLPSLEHLILHRLDCHHIENIGEGFKLEKSEIHCMKYSLKTLQLENFRFHKGEMELLEYFVLNSSVLNEIRLSRFSRCEKQPELLFLNKLLTFPRCSNAFRIIVCD